MKIAIDVRDASGEKAGKGSFAFGLVSQILAQDSHDHFILYTDQESVPFPDQTNVLVKKIAARGPLWHLRVLKDISHERPDVYFAPTSYIIPALAPRWLKVVLVVHDIVAFLFPQQHLKKAIFIERLSLRKALKKATRVVAVSKNTQKDLIKYFQTPESIISVVPCAPNPDYSKVGDAWESEQVRKKYHLPEKFILGVGTLEPRKNFPNLIKSFAKFRKHFPEYKLVIAGKKGWQSDDIQETVKNLHLKDHVILTGYIDDSTLRQLYRLAEMFVFPSRYEGFGIPPLEAMASGCPVIASNTSSLPEVVGNAGILIDPENIDEIAAAMKTLVDDRELKATLIERGYLRLKKFSWKNSAKIVLKLFDEMR